MNIKGHSEHLSILKEDLDGAGIKFDIIYFLR